MYDFHPRFKRTLSMIMVTILCVLSPELGIATSPENQVPIRQWAIDQSELQTQRASQTYQRIYGICSQGFELNKLQYVYESAKQVKEILSANEEIFQKMSYRHSAISPQLVDDLNDQSFFTAINDCGLSESERNQFVASLLVLDLSGKLLSISGVLKLGQLLGSSMQLIRARSAVAFWSISAAMATQTAIELWHKIQQNNQEDTDKIKKQSEQEKNQVNDLTLQMQGFTRQGDLQNQKLKQMLVAMYDQEIAQDNVTIAQNPENQMIKSHLKKLQKARLELLIQVHQ